MLDALSQLSGALLCGSRDVGGVASLQDGLVGRTLPGPGSLLLLHFPATTSEEPTLPQAPAPMMPQHMELSKRGPNPLKLEPK